MLTSRAGSTAPLRALAEGDPVDGMGELRGGKPCPVGKIKAQRRHRDASSTLASLDNADRKIAYALQMLKDRVEATTCRAGRTATRRAALPTRRGRHLILDWTGFHLHIDDDIWPDEGAQAPMAQTRIDITIQAQALSVLVPDEVKGEE